MMLDMRLREHPDWREPDELPSCEVLDRPLTEDELALVNRHYEVVVSEFVVRSFERALQKIYDRCCHRR